MNFGAPELLVILLLAIAFILPIFGIVKAILAKEWGWVAAIVISTGFALGGITTLIYLWSHRSRARV